MTTPSNFGQAPFVLSAHTGGGSSIGHTAAEGLNDTIDLARTADALGYHRFWMSEHHAMPALSVASPPLMLARLIGETQNIRLGAGGVMLPNHAPLIIAEQFGMLEAMSPGRIDLGIGRAPGTDPMTAQALRRSSDTNDSFPEQLDELLGFLRDDFPDGHPYFDVHAVPGPWQARLNKVARPSIPPVWILGSSVYSAHIAAKLGRPYAFALQFGDADITTAMRIYEENFTPSDVLQEPYSLVSVGTIVAEDEKTALSEASSGAMAMLRMFKHQPYQLFSPEEISETPLTLNEQAIIEAYTHRTYVGTADSVAARLEALHAQTGVNEIMTVLGSYTPGTDKHTLELLADHYKK